MRGEVEKFLEDKGYGFIKGDDGKKYFVRWTEVIPKKGFKTLHDGQEVDFDEAESEENDKGPYAKNVKPI